MLLLRLDGSLLLRFAERQLLALLFHEPPRKTRVDPGYRSVPRSQAPTWRPRANSDSGAY